ncbi:sugar ABC transporter ATP-binding protein [Salinisphaera sp. Q1T1-3]|uniref:sugar ABC transporter ATP-binding protein n=1 Tax=Salinisphaera sp. Q1T1-3 TaxID=2321229 RepID=UPI000E733341|nr:sugar ABC transporter ATP-binding protein [Salinisphaera sp. Q1T1-3]RJS91865.1 sugar ABC transporter ATP-binding protein [Salinisphaera sp. Q1T1-3]
MTGNEQLAAPDRAEEHAVFSARGVSKVYPGTTALRDVDFDVLAGRVNVLIGENGAGKSTLMKILAGIERPTAGRLSFEGQPYDVASPREAMALGIGIVHQELNLFPNLSVAQNLFVGRERRGIGGTLRRGEQRRIARDVFERMGQPIDVDALVSELSIGRQQIVEIARVLVSDVRILILDEPTSSLSEDEVAVLFRLLSELRQQGVAIVYISHRLEELIEIGDTFTVLRDGALIETGWRDQVDIPWLVERMVGSRVEGPYRQVPADHRPDPDAATVLAVENLQLPDAVGGRLLDDVSFRVTQGEIVGFYGLMGAGRTELFETLIGLRRASAGRVTVAGRELAVGDDVATRIAAGLALVPEDRQRLGLVQSQSVARNIALTHLKHYTRVTGLDFGAMKNDVQRMIDELLIKVSDPDVLVSALSGGNQQKAVVGKNLLTEPKVLLLDEPTRGIDIKARRELFEIMDRLARQGLTILYASSDLNEITGGADRVLVMAEGRITADLRRAELTEDALVGSAQVQRLEKDRLA